MKTLDFSRSSLLRVYVLTAVGTCFCIAVAFAFDSYSMKTNSWTWGARPINNLIIPLLLAPPLFYYLLSKLRELSIAHKELLAIASTDVLTACLNRRAFTALVDGYMEKVSEQGRRPTGALLVVDVDNFKAVNDAFGHDKGDEALKLIADTLKANVRDIDLVGRLGGEEFSVFMPDLDEGHSADVANRLRTAVNEIAFIPYRDRHTVSISVGGSVFERRTTFADLYRHADQRLYAAKNAGRNRIDIVPLSQALAA
jgi:diguanylate cyclase (GGDEF)-like protein